MSFETIGAATLYLGDCREILPTVEADACVTDPPYGVTSLEWDRTVDGWPELVRARHLWCFGSMRFFMAAQFPGWTYGQEIVWEKHNGSNFHADRFRRVHELAVHFYRGDWASLYKSPVMRLDATARAVRRKARPAHTGHIGAAAYTSEDGGPRMERSVIYARSCHGSAVHPTQKPVEILQPLIEYSCPPGGLVVDPFGGSFSAGVACLASGRRYVGIEVDPERFAAGLRNLEDAQRQARLIA
jgi:site-specific DNA-methyltransferase (adenine-specific)